MTDSSRDAYAILTEFTNVCSGVAVISEHRVTTAGLMHVYSHSHLATQGKIEDKVKSAWDAFKNEMNARRDNNQLFKCVLFGGRTKESLGVPEEVDPEILSEHNRLHGRLLDVEEDFKRSSRELFALEGDALEAEMRIWGERNKAAEQEFADWVGYDLAKANISDEASQMLQACGKYNQWLASHEISEGLLRLASDEEGISGIADMRDNMPPHDFFIDTRSKEIMMRSTPLQYFDIAGNMGGLATAPGAIEIADDYIYSRS